MSGKKAVVTRRRWAKSDHLWKDHDPPPSTAPVDHARALETTRWLTENQYHRWRPDAVRVDPEEVIQLLNRAGVKFILMGQHGIGGWLSHARATRDVDVLVQKRHHAKAVRAIHEAYPALTQVDHVVVTRFLDPKDGDPVIDVMKPRDLYAEAFKNTIRVGDSHDVPNLELALASKFAALVSRNRDVQKKYLDASDFIQLVQRNHAAIDEVRLRQLGEAVYIGGGEALLKYVADVKAGRRLRV
ncbi:MAG TPA: hypothetical protein VMV69_25330 [Pirellulales bacterium]|nr:hypothetical protein [Pirellulales bacterium]